MPLHEWSTLSGWEGVHHLWISELLFWVKPRLPSGYRAYIGSAPMLAVGSPSECPDIGVREWTRDDVQVDAGTVNSADEDLEPERVIAVATMDSHPAVYVEQQGRLISAIELISPRNKDRPQARDVYLARYLGYLMNGVHLVLVDVHPRPLGFSFADAIAELMKISQPPCPPPMAVTYRMGESTPDGGRFVDLWRRPLTAGSALPKLPLPLNVDRSVVIDLELTYIRAAAGAYIS